jgi:hypothetical protein
MNHLRKRSLSVALLLSIMALTGAGTASATELYKYTAPSPNDTLGVGTELLLSMKPGTSMILQDTWSTPFTLATCAGGELQGKTTSAGGESSHPSGPFSAVKFTNCTHTMDIEANGEFKLEHIAGTTDATVLVNGLKIKHYDTYWGLNCTRTINGAFGTLTGATSATGYATIDVIANLSGICGPARLTGTFTVTAPIGLIVEAK